MSHLGRPNGSPNAKYSLAPVVPELEKLLGKKIKFLDQSVGQKVQEAVDSGSNGQVFVLENLRFHIEEEGSSKDPSGKKVKADQKAVEIFRKDLTALGDVYISEHPLFPNEILSILLACR